MRYGANSNETTPYNKYMSKVVQKGNKVDPIYTKIKMIMLFCIVSVYAITIYYKCVVQIKYCLLSISLGIILRFLTSNKPRLPIQ